MRRGERIPLHDHSNDDSGGIVATTRARLIAQSASSTPGDIGGGSSGGGSGSTTSAELTLQLSDDSTADFEIDWSKDVTDVTLTANVTYTYANFPATNIPTPHLLIRRMGPGGPFTETFPAETEWDDGTGFPGGTQQALNAGEDARTSATLFTEDGGTTVGASAGGGSSGAAAIEILDEGVSLTTTPVSINFVGAGVTATESTDAVTVTIPGATSSAADHEHIMDVLFSGDASTTVFNLPAAPVNAYSVAAYVSGVLTEVTLSGAMLDVATFGSAPASATNNVRFDIVAAVL